MKNLSSIDKDKLFFLVEEKLKCRFGDLPKFGVIAGQAVASAIYEIVGVDVAPSYNDLDVFYIENAERSNLGSNEFNKGRHFKTTRPSKRIGVPGSNMLSAGSISKNSYEVVSCGYDGEKNYIGIHLSKDYGGIRVVEELASTIIKGFDINCCQAGINLSTKEVVWTPEFENFLYHKQLRAVSYLTCQHTAVRLVRKAKELNFATLDLDVEMYKIQTARKVMMSIQEARSEGLARPVLFPGNLFSDVYREKYLKEEKELSSYFRMNSRDARIHTKGGYEHVTFYELEPLKYDEIVHKFMVDYACNCDNFETAMTDFESVWQLHLDGKKNRLLKGVIDKVSDALVQVDSDSGVLLKSMIMDIVQQRPSFAVNTGSENLVKMSLFLKKHPYLQQAIYNTGLDFKESYHIAKKLSWLDKNGLNILIGLIEQDGQIPLERTDDQIRITLDELRSSEFHVLAAELKQKLLAEYRQMRFESRYQHGLDFSVGEYDVSEICDFEKLYLEGEQQNHCVAGYWSRIEKDLSAIFSIKSRVDKKDNATLMVSSTKDFEIQQCYGRFNSDPGDGIKSLASKIVDQLNEKFGSQKLAAYEINEAARQKEREGWSEAPNEYDLDGIPF
jgi:hypothetical protein